MEYKIALLLKEHYRKYVEQWEKFMPADTRLNFLPYKTLDEMKDIFLTVKGDYDGFYVSGIIPYHAIQTLGEMGRDAVIGYSPIDIENTYRILIQKMVSVKNQQLSRVGMDFLKSEENLEELIMTDRFADAVHIYEARWESRESISQINKEEADINKFYLEQCKKNKFDIIITYFYSVVESLKNFDVECFYVYPNAQAFCQIIDGIKNNISLNHMKNNLAAVIHIDMEEMRKQKGEEFGEFQKKVMEAAQQFNRQYYNKMILKENYMDVEFFTDYEFLKTLTKGFTCCPLQSRLKKEMGFSGYIGYGIGSSIYQARLNAIDASHYGRNVKEMGDGSFLVDEKDTLTILNTQGAGKVISVQEGYVNQIANQVKLSSETILKIIGVMQSLGTNDITSQDLMDSLQISLRTANKFLSNLEKYGFAAIIQQKRNGNKGRPVNVYHLKLDY